MVTLTARTKGQFKAIIESFSDSMKFTGHFNGWNVTVYRDELNVVKWRYPVTLTILSDKLTQLHSASASK